MADVLEKTVSNRMEQNKMRTSERVQSDVLLPDLRATSDEMVSVDEKIISVLDNGYVRLVDSMGSDLSVVRSARVSYDAAWRAGTDKGSDTRLINYLWRNHHTSPFESVEFQFEVKAPIFVLRQWHRHRTWSYNEVSARYRKLDSDCYIPNLKDIGVQSESNKQMRTFDNECHVHPESLNEYREAIRQAFKVYDSLIGQGWPRELARMVLPMSTYSTMFAKVDLLNLFKFLRLRDHEHAQWEIREYAKAMKQLITPIVPACMEAFESCES